MRQPTDYRRRRIAVAACAALLLCAGGRETPTFGTIEITLDERLRPQVDAAWSPPLALGIAAADRVVTLLGSY